MSLPRKARPVFNCTLPVSKVKVEYHPMRREEEKILLMAKESAQAEGANQIQEILPAIKQIVDHCVEGGTKVTANLSVVDLEYMFIRIRMVSVSDVAPVSYHDPDDDQDYNFEVKLAEVKAVVPEVAPHIKLNEDMVLSLRYPPATLYSDTEFLALKGEEQFDRLIVSCLDKVFVNDEATKFSDVPVAEAIEWLNDLDHNDFQKIREFLDNLPSLHYSIKYKNTNGKERELVLSTLTDFFSFV